MGDKAKYCYCLNDYTINRCKCETSNNEADKLRQSNWEHGIGDITGKVTE